MAKPNLTAKRVQEVLQYNQETGVFTWKRKLSNTIHIGDVAGNFRKTGYVCIQVDGKIYFAHRLAWLYMTGEMPIGEVDHKIGLGNQWSNLRDGNKSQNMQNKRKAHLNNKSTGILGVSYHKKRKKYTAQIGVGGKKIHLGEYKTAEEAQSAYIAAKRRLHPGCTL